MKAPTRLFESGTETEQRLVRALRSARPSAASRRRMALAVGVGVGVGVGAATVGASAASAATATATSISAVTSKSATWLASFGLGKVVGTIAVGALVASATVAEVAHVQGSPGQAVMTVRTEVTHAPEALRTRGQARGSEPIHELAKDAPIPSELAPARPTPPTRPALETKPEPLAETPPTPAESASPPPALTLGDETLELGEAQRALDGGHAEEALALLERHDRDFPNPVLDLEADFLRIEIFAALGRTSEARSRGQSFLRAHSAAPQARRVQTLLSEIDTSLQKP
jgi:hypothetical protein